MCFFHVGACFVGESIILFKWSHFAMKMLNHAKLLVPPTLQPTLAC